MDTIVIKDFDTALDAIVEKYAHPDFDAFELAPEANIKIKLEGAQWDGQLDYKVAEFIVKLQKSLVDQYNVQTGEKIRYNTGPMESGGLRVTVSVEQGCTLFNINLAGWWNNMESKHQLAAIVITAGLFAGVYAYTSVHGDDAKITISENEAKSRIEEARIKAKTELEAKVQERIQDETRQKVVLSTVEKALDTAIETNQHMSFLASKMHPKDKMHIDGITLPAKAAKRVFKPSTMPDDDIAESRYFLDGEYVVTSINREKDEATIRFDDKRRTFSLASLDDAARAVFYKNCAQGKKNKFLLPMPLQLTAFFKGGVFKHGFIQDIGAQREDSMTFSGASLASASKEEDNLPQDDME